MLLKLIVIFLITLTVVYSQNGFIKTTDDKFSLENREFKFIGFNVYYLQSEAG